VLDVVFPAPHTLHRRWGHRLCDTRAEVNIVERERQTTPEATAQLEIGELYASTRSMPYGLKLKGGKLKLKVVVYPGHQMKKTINNVTLVLTPEGINFAHLGDQINEGDFMVDFDWIDHVKEHFKVDFIMPTVWANDLVRITRGFDPKMVFLGHANELGHPVYDRDPFWGDTVFSEPSLKALLKSDYPVLMTTWGESYHYMPK